MILDRHPSIDIESFKKVYSNEKFQKILFGPAGNWLKFLGYWHALFLGPSGIVKGSEFDSYEKKCGVGRLPVPWDYQDASWDPAERALTIQYLQRGTQYESWRGSSPCRFGCNGEKLGYRDYTDGVYVWPEGFAHYVEVHDVRPPESFLEHLRGMGG